MAFSRLYMLFYHLVSFIEIFMYNHLLTNFELVTQTALPSYIDVGDRDVEQYHFSPLTFEKPIT